MPNLGWGLKSISEWCMVGFDSKNMHQKKIGLRAQKLLTILNTIANIIERTYAIIY